MLLSFFSNLVSSVRHEINGASFLDALNNYTTKGYLLLLISIPIFLGVYSDEVSSHSMQCIIGRGLTRKKILWAKLIDCVLITTIVFVIYMGLQALILPSSGVSFSSKQMHAYIAYGLICILKIVGASTFSMMLLFITNAMPVGIIGVIFFTTLSPNLVRLLYSFEIKAVDYSYDMLLFKAMNKLVAGAFAWELIPCVVLYIVGAWLITYLFFRRKEFDF